MHPPHRPKTNDFGRKISLQFEKSVSISGCIPPHQPKPNDFGRKISLNFGEHLFFFFLGDHLILGGKNVWISDFGRKSLSISVNTFFFVFWRPPDFGRKKRLNFRFRPENHSQFRWRPFFLFFGDHLILGGKNAWISDFGRKITLNFGEDIRIFEVLCLKFLLSPPPKFSTSATAYSPRLRSVIQ